MSMRLKVAGVVVSVSLILLIWSWPSEPDRVATSAAHVAEADEPSAQVATAASAMAPSAETTGPMNDRETGSDESAEAQRVSGVPEARRIERVADGGDGDRERRLREAARNADALPAERRFLSGHRLDLRTFRDVLGSDDFLDAFHELAADSMADNDALALTDVYADFAEQAFGRHGQFALDRMACGLRMCMGQAVALSDQAIWSLHGLDRLEGGPPMPASAAGVWIGPNGQRFYQFLFTNDPESRGLVVSGP